MLFHRQSGWRETHWMAVLTAAALFVAGLVATAATTAWAATTLKFASLSEPYPEYFQVLIEDFRRENPDIEIQVEGIPFNRYFDVIEARLTAGSTEPDVFWVDVPLVASYSARGFLYPLEEFVTPEQIAAFTPAAAEAGMYEGRLMAIPLQSSSQLLYYNADMFRAAGLPLPSSDPEQRLTWAEVVELARKLTGSGQWGFSFEQVDRPYQLLPLPQSLGGESADPTGTQVVGYIDSPAWVRAATFYRDPYHTWQVSPPGVIYPQTTDLFEAGRLGMLLGTELQVKRFQQNVTFEWGIAPHPYFADGEPVTPTGSWYIGINKNSPNLEAAGRWVSYLASERAGRLWYQLSGRLPVHQSVVDQMEALATTDIERLAARLVGYQELHTARPRPTLVGYREWEDALYRAFADIRNGADPAATLQATARRLQGLLARYR